MGIKVAFQWTATYSFRYCWKQKIFNFSHPSLQISGA
jgi:hypothetical protein